MVEARLRRALSCQGFNDGILVGGIWFVVQQREHLRVHAAQQKSFRFQEPEFSGPHGTGGRKPLPALLCLFLGTNEIAMRQRAPRLRKRGLRVDWVSTAQPAGKQEKDPKRGYG